MTVQDLRRQGCRVRLLHYRLAFLPNGTDVDVGLFPASDLKAMHQLCLADPKGGKTVVDVQFPDGNNIHAEAECSLRDQFRKKTGVAIALGRVMKQRATKTDDQWYAIAEKRRLLDKAKEMADTADPLTRQAWKP